MNIIKNNIRIRNKSLFTTNQSRKTDRIHSRTLSQIKQPFEQDYLAEVNKIMVNAKEESKLLNLQFRKYTLKPQVQAVYIDPSILPAKLAQLSNRIEVGKYHMLIQVRKDAVQKMAIKKQIVTDQIQKKKYQAIYNQYLKNQNTIQIVNNPIVSLYQFYDEQEKDWKQSLKNKKLIGRQKLKNQGQRSRSNSRKDFKDLEDCPSKEDRKISIQFGSMYSAQFEEIANENNMFHQQKILPRAQKIVTDMFQSKFYKSRQKKFELMFERQHMKKQKQEVGQQQEFNFSPGKRKPIKLKVPESCKKVFNTQNKLLEKNINKGLSEENKTKLIIEFNKTISEMKPRQNSEQSPELEKKKSQEKLTKHY